MMQSDEGIRLARGADGQRGTFADRPADDGRAAHVRGALEYVSKVREEAEHRAKEAMNQAQTLREDADDWQRAAATYNELLGGPGRNEVPF